MTVDCNCFPNNKLNVEIVTSGSDPDKHCIIQLTMWPRTPTPFGDKGYTVSESAFHKVCTTLVQPYKDVSENLADTDFAWALRKNGPIYREAGTLYGTWMDCINYLKELYCCAKDIVVVNRSVHCDRVFYKFLYNMCRDYHKQTHKEITKDSWPFTYDISEFDQKYEEADINPCPFCGSTQLKVDFKTDYSSYWVRCTSGNCSVVYGPWRSTKEKAIEAWNKRF